ncbi:DNA-binding LacI/PurR family transcriptional regulator [Kribbella sp. VKM Ac-2527]|uniref:DNA-binding LacI/PurR family transcriptional regulator n=1 Tax=Kribbella caucasensis TaxID=2512215 RepID=A0A4R6J876_9ACTN|nr:LacI family DNA-binding transcriptional regulator [Kribbella sp. VKM Ac-2527]TDO30586.1 DNA-binding LacI/PurR family transcriptional regulator [Kribbella sp. VKM Ac-2527]
MVETVRTGPTMAVVARMAGVSVPTVSKVINGRGGVGAATRQKVTEALLEVGYLRRPSKPSDQPGSGRLIDVVMHGLRTTYAANVLDGIEAAARDAGLDIVVASSDYAHRHREYPGGGWLDHLIDRGTAGVLLVLLETTAAQHDWLTHFGIPCVIVDPISPPPPGVPTVAADNEGGGAAATRHLIELGHQRIAYIGGSPGKLCAKARLAGYRTAMSDAGLPIPESYLHDGNFNEPDAALAMAKLLAQPTAKRPTAVFVASDLMAVSACRVIREHGLQVGKDISVVGFDDVDEARATAPMLTTVRQPLGEMGATGLRLLFDRMRGADPQGHVELPIELIVRESAVPN